VHYRGAAWDVELAPHATASGGEFRIVEVRGNVLVVAPKH
jgi:membrane protein implicated in regulation of membrane protease activity